MDLRSKSVSVNVAQATDFNSDFATHIVSHMHEHFVRHCYLAENMVSKRSIDAWMLLQVYLRHHTRYNGLMKVRDK